jgi:WD40 repeat protein
VNYGLAALIGVAMLVLAWFATLDSGPAPPRLRMARGDGDPRARTTAFTYSPDGETIATTHEDGRVALRSPTEGWSLPRFLADRGHALAIAFAPDGKSLALGGDDPDITWCDLGSKGTGRPLGMSIHQTSALAFAPDGRTLAATSYLSDQIILWDLAARRERTRLRGHSSPVLSLAFSPDGRSLASGGRWDQALIVWDLATGGRRLRLEAPGPVPALAYSPDGSLLASASSAFEHSVRIWDPPTGRVVRRIGSYAPSRNSLAFAPGGRLLATADNDGMVKLWDVATGRHLASLDGHADWLGGVAFSPDGRTLVAAGNDDDVRLWDVTEVLGTQTDHPADR